MPQLWTLANRLHRSLSTAGGLQWQAAEGDGKGPQRSGKEKSYTTSQAIDFPRKMQVIYLAFSESFYVRSHKILLANLIQIGLDISTVECVEM